MPIQQLLIFDGACGSELQKRGLPAGMPPYMFNRVNPDEVVAMHRSYIRAGADVLLSNTFGLSYADQQIEDTIQRACALLDRARSEESPERTIRFALDIGPIGALLAPLGDLPFEDAVAHFSRIVRAGVKAGADLILIETMTDLYELKAAVLAAKSESNLPIIASFTPGVDRRLLTGADIVTAATTLEGLSVDAIGINCGEDPQRMLAALLELRQATSLPLLFSPNAGLPHPQADGSASYDCSPFAFAEVMKEAYRAGAAYLGGCCGTTPEHTRALKDALVGITPQYGEKAPATAATSSSQTVFFSERTVIIGERINPTGKPKLQNALQSGDFDYLAALAKEQQQAGAAVLDVNVGAPGVDEMSLLVSASSYLQQRTTLPLMLDSGDPGALYAAAFRYNGKPLINSVNGKKESMDAVFPIVKQFGGVLVTLTLDESGIPETPAGRLAIAKKILQEAMAYGLSVNDLLFDPLTMALSADRQNALTTLQTIRLLKSALGVKTVLGISNVSFGMPAREKLNTAMLSMAMSAGLDAVILNPTSRPMLDTITASHALLGKDETFSAFLSAFSDQPTPAKPKVEQKGTLREAVEAGLSSLAKTRAEEALLSHAPLAVIDEQLIPALDTVGRGFEEGTLFLPQLMQSAEAAKAAFAVLSDHLPKEDGETNQRILIATVAGDIHDIGKNIAKALLQSYRYQVIDLGRDIAPERILEEAKAQDIRLVGLSALMTTTLPSMQETVRLLKKELPDCRIMVGGAVLDASYAATIGADAYVPDAMASVRYANTVFQD